jgi:hypothetical protein
MLVICHICNESKESTEYHSYKSHGKVYFRKLCKICDDRQKWQRDKISPQYRKRLKAKNERNKLQRKDPLYTHKFILKDSKDSDRKSGFKNDLTKKFVQEAIKDGCSYCGESSIRMTLDRVDNSIGHTVTNVVSCCIRCNYVRRDMPHGAWLLVIPAMRAAREKGLFEGWDNRVK